MGDADSEIIVPENEIVSWMDEAQGVVDEGLDHLFLYMINVNDRTKQILRKLESLEYFRLLFTSMNLLVVPVVIAILLCYSTRNTVDIFGLEVYYQLVVTFLMFISGSIGLPFYIYSLWELYNANRQIKSNVLAVRQNVPRTNSGRLDSRSLSEDSFLTFLSNEATAERLNDFARILTYRMPGGMRADLGRREDVIFPGANDESSEMGIVTLLTDSSNPPSEGLVVENGSVTEFEFQESKENLSDFEVQTVPNAIDSYNNEAIKEKDTDKLPPKRESKQDIDEQPPKKEPKQDTDKLVPPKRISKQDTDNLPLKREQDTDTLPLKRESMQDLGLDHDFESNLKGKRTFAVGRGTENGVATKRMPQYSSSFVR